MGRFSTTMDDPIRERVEKATVQLTKRGGQGVLVPGGFILTAAHCIDWSSDGAMVLGDHYVEPFTTKSGTSPIASPLAVEPVTDLAALGAVDNQESYDECEKFEEFCEDTPPVPVANQPRERGDEFPIYILSHTGEWITGHATQCGLASCRHSLFIETKQPIESGTSGGPVVDEHGQLVGVVSYGSRDGSIPRPDRCLPVWLWQQISEAQKG